MSSGPSGWLSHHARMLGDLARLGAFRQAIARLTRSEDVVADVGTGSGILASYAAALTRGTVYAIEYNRAVAELARKMFLSSRWSHVKVLQGRSYPRTLHVRPRIGCTALCGARMASTRLISPTKRKPAFSN